MPVESRYSEMDYNVSPGNKLHDIGRMGSHDSGFSSRSRNSVSDDDFMNYMSHEEKECILFFETTLDSLKDDFEECSSISSVKSEGPATPTQINSGNEIIDLVATRSLATEYIPRYDNVIPVDKGNGVLQKEEFLANQEKPQLKQAGSPPPTTYAAPFKKQRSFDRTSPEPEIEPARAYYSQTKPPGSVPTPMVVAQKIAEKKVGNGTTSPMSPTESKRFTYENDRTNSASPTDRQEFQYKNAKLQRFPSNISISMANKEYNKTITKASVKVQERKAQVLANLGGTSLLVAESDDRQQKDKLNGPRRSLSFKEVVSSQARGEAPSKLAHVKESEETDSAFPSDFKAKVRKSASGQSMKIQPVSNGSHMAGPVTPAMKTPTSKPETKEIPHQSASLNASEICRSRSIQKPSGFRPQGITVQFSGRGSTDESRKDALRKLGLLRINDVQ
ncbi:proline and serine-rich protein 2-like [Heterodontus francisci]|uniref:proline and serine-rich protein 2-like n=1 Tax=Heterodontus francisci TaxID=7792 RepID=UPI00355BB9EA